MMLLGMLMMMLSMGMASSHRYSAWERVSVLSCATNLTRVAWDFQSVSGFYTKLCQYEPAFGSWTYCIHEQLLETANEATFVKSLIYINQFCSLVNNGEMHRITLDDYYSSLYNASRYLEQVPSDADAEEKSKVRHPIKVDSLTRRKINLAYYYFLVNFDNANSYALWLIWYFVTLISIACVLMIPFVRQWLFRIPNLNAIRGKFLLPTLHGTHTVYFPNRWATGLVPTRLESLVVLGFVLSNAIALCYNYKIDGDNTVFRSNKEQWYRQVADRAGILSFAHFPLIIIFSTRNSMLEQLIGIKYTTSIVLHKWIGRSMAIDACIHSVCYFLYAQETGSINNSRQQYYWKIGILATYIAVSICFLSLGFLRRNHYEAFLYLHIALASSFFYCCWSHIKNFGWENWIRISTAAWILERIFRLKSILKFGFKTAKLESLGPDLFNVRIPRPENWTTEPAQHVFLYFLEPITICWQSHPFTFIDLDEELLIVIRAKEGATRRLLDHLLQKGGKTQMKVLVEGPYGSPSPLFRFQNSLLLCGGSGIPGPLSYLLRMTKSLSSGSQHPNPRIVVVSRSIDILNAYSIAFLRLKHLNVDLKIYITGPQSNLFHPNSTNSRNYGSTLMTSTLVPHPATVYYGRPNISEIIARSVTESSSLAICCCGPPAFVDSTRDSVAQIIRADATRNKIENNDGCVIEYFEEYQTW